MTCTYACCVNGTSQHHQKHDEVSVPLDAETNVYFYEACQGMCEASGGSSALRLSTVRTKIRVRYYFSVVIFYQFSLAV